MEDIMGGQNFSSAGLPPQISPKWFFKHKFCIFDENLLTRRFANSPKFDRREIPLSPPLSPPATTTLVFTNKYLQLTDSICCQYYSPVCAHSCYWFVISGVCLWRAVNETLFWYHVITHCIFIHTRIERPIHFTPLWAYIFAERLYRSTADIVYYLHSTLQSASGVIG